MERILIQLVCAQWALSLSDKLSWVWLTYDPLGKSNDQRAVSHSKYAEHTQGHRGVFYKVESMSYPANFDKQPGIMIDFVVHLKS